MIKRTLYAIAVYCFNGQNRIFNNFLQLRKKIRKENSPNKLAQSQVPSPNRPEQMQRSKSGPQVRRLSYLIETMGAKTNLDSIFFYKF